MAPESPKPKYPPTEGMTLMDILRSDNCALLVADVMDTFNQSGGRIDSMLVADIKEKFPSWYDFMMKLAAAGHEGCRIEKTPQGDM